MMKVLVCSPVWRAFEAAHVLALFNLMTHEECDWYPLVNDAAIDRARSRGATYFLEKTDADVALWLDSDIDFRDEDALTICRQAIEYGIVCGPYVTRSKTSAIIASRLKLEQAYTFNGDQAPREIQWAAGGFTAVHRRVYEALATQDIDCQTVLHPQSDVFRMRNFYLPMDSIGDDGSPIYLSEDWAFAERARALGYPSYMNCAVRLAHVGTARYTLEDLYAKYPPQGPLRVTRGSDGTLIEHD